MTADMKSDKVDRRVKYTKMVIKESFISILEKKDISRITIKEICEAADINRATFYAHYSDQYDLLRKIENELLDNIKIHLDGYNEKNTSTSHIIMAERIFEYIYDNSRLCKLLLSEQGNFSFQKKMMMLVYDIVIAELTGNRKLSLEDAEYIYSFTITGTVGLVQKWFDEGMKKTPHYMAEMVIRLVLGLINELQNHSY
jgi:AcrR family transcriptional regulator